MEIYKNYEIEESVVPEFIKDSERKYIAVRKYTEKATDVIWGQSIEEVKQKIDGRTFDEIFDDHYDRLKKMYDGDENILTFLHRSSAHLKNNNIDKARILIRKVMRRTDKNEVAKRVVLESFNDFIDKFVSVIKHVRESKIIEFRKEK